MSVKRLKKWTEEEDLILRQKYPHCSNREMSYLLNRTSSSVSNRAIKLGVKKCENYLIKKGQAPKKVRSEILRELYIKRKLSIPDLADELGVSRSTVRLRLIENNIPLRSRAEGIRGAKHKISLAHKGKKVEFTETHKRNISLAKLKQADKTAIGISRKKHSGYLEITRGVNKGKSYHRAAMEGHLGRKLKGDEVVHHKDGNKLNNRLCNLQVMTASEHARLHAIERYKTRKRNRYGQFE